MAGAFTAAICLDMEVDCNITITHGRLLRSETFQYRTQGHGNLEKGQDCPWLDKRWGPYQQMRCSFALSI